MKLFLDNLIINMFVHILVLLLIGLVIHLYNFYNRRK